MTGPHKEKKRKGGKKKHMRWTNLILPHMDEFHPSSKPRWVFSKLVGVLCVCVCVFLWVFLCVFLMLLLLEVLLLHAFTWLLSLVGCWAPHCFLLLLASCKPIFLFHLFSEQKSYLDSLAKTAKFVSFSVVFEREREREIGIQKEERDRQRQKHIDCHLEGRRKEEAEEEEEEEEEEENWIVFW